VASDETKKLRREIAAIGLITAAALTFASLMYGSQESAGFGGYLPGLIATALNLSFGVGAYVVPAVLLIVGVLFALEKPNIASGRALAGAGLLFLVILTVTAMHVPASSRFDPEWVALYGGYVGAGLAAASLGIFGWLGSWIILIGFAVVSLIMLVQTSVKSILLGGASLLSRAFSAVWTTIRDGLAELRETLSTSRVSTPAPKRKARGSTRKKPANPPLRVDRGPVVELDLDEDGEPIEPAQADAAPASSGGSTAKKRNRSSSAPKKKSGGDQPVLLEDDDLYTLPSINLFSVLEDGSHPAEAVDEATENIIKLEDTLESFGVEAKVVAYERGPVITRYEVEPGSGVRVSKIVNLSDDLAMALAAVDVRVEAPIPGKSAVGIEVPNQRRGVVSLRSLIEDDVFRNHPSPLAAALGRDIAGHPVIADLSHMPHLLVAGATNSGKSVCLHSIISSILMRVRPSQVKFIMIDPKRVELRLYEGIPHLMAPVVYSPKEAADALRKVIREMDKRYDKFALKSVVNIDEYNTLAAEAKEHRDQEFDPVPHIVVIIDELADLMMQSRSEFEFSICRLAQLARATGIHLVIATQRPSVNVITGTIKANIPSRIALSVTSQHDSRTILDGMGAERLIGRGDMLYSPIDDNQTRRLQGAFIPRPDLQRLVDHLCSQGEPEYEIIPQAPDDDEGDFAGDLEVSDTLYTAAVEHVVGEGEASVSGLQRRFKIGYARAGRLIDAMEQRGVVGPHEGPKPRQLLLNPMALEAHLGGGSHRHPEDIDLDYGDDEEFDDHEPEELEVEPGAGPDLDDPDSADDLVEESVARDD
jgi:DNA segregation ATPase FtsK/SpoIIIE, S-DNA-T family